MTVNQLDYELKDNLKSEKNLLLLDGYGFLFRAYHSLPPFTNPVGVPVGAVHGFVNMLLKLLADHSSDYFAVIFDSGKETFRNKIYSEYKANRPEAPEDLIPQFSLVRKAVEAFNIRAIDKVGFEADDLIATYARLGKEQGFKVTIISSDKDLIQLMNDKVSLFDPMKQNYITAEMVREKYGILPEKMLDLLSMTGDSSDNIPGIAGIGVKTAAQLLNEFGSLENVLSRVQEIKQNKRRETIIACRDKALLSKKLVTLDYHVPIDTAIEEFKIKPYDKNKLLAFLTEHNFQSVIKRLEKNIGAFLSQRTNGLPNEQIINPITNIVDVSQDNLQNNIKFIGNISELEAYIKAQNTPEILSLYSYFSAEDNKINKISLGFNHTNLIVINLKEKEKSIQASLFEDKKNADFITLEEVCFTLKDILLDPAVIKIGFDLKPLLKILFKLNLNIDPFDDVMIMAYAYSAGKYEHDLHSLALNLLNMGKGDFPEINFKKASEEEVNNYIITANKIIIKLYAVVKQNLFKEKALSIYHKLDKPLITVLANMENLGIKVDHLMLKLLSDNFAKEIINLEKIIYRLAGKEFNIASPKQLGEILFVDLGIKGGRKSKKTGLFSTDVEILDSLATEGVEIAEYILQYRTIAKLKNTYTDALYKQIAKDGRVHTHYSMAMVNTGRLSSRDPNLQNIPIRTELGNNIRAVFIAEKDYKLISADYSQIELRLLAHMAEVKSLQEAFHLGKDIHALTASEIFGVELESVTSELRRRAKAINFGIIYGMSGFGLARRLGIEKSEAADYIAKYFAKYPGILAYMEKTKQFAFEHGFVETIFGRKCYIKGINERNGMIRQFAERAAINAPLQGSAADIVKKSMVELDILFAKYGKNQVRSLLQVHDELIIEVKEELSLELSDKIKKTMENIYPISVPLTVSLSCGDNWKEIH